MDTLCRVCIKKAAKCTLLNTKIENSSNLSFFDFLNKCTKLNACESDKLPQSICSICTRSIKTFYSFVKLAEKSDIILREALRKSIATGRCNNSREISCEEITITNYKVEEEPEGFSKEESLHGQTSRSSTGSPLYILDLVKEEPRVSESTSIDEFKGAEINEIEKLHCNLDHPEGSVEEPDDILLCIDRRLASKKVVQKGAPDPRSVRRSDHLIDNRGISCEEITIKNEKIKRMQFLTPAVSTEMDNTPELHLEVEKVDIGVLLKSINEGVSQIQQNQNTILMELAKQRAFNDIVISRINNIDSQLNNFLNKKTVETIEDSTIASSASQLIMPISNRNEMDELENQLNDRKTMEDLEESEELNKEESLHYQTGKNSTGSSFYILDIKKEEPRVSESTSIVYFKDAEITESEKFHSNLVHPGESIEEPDDTLSCIDGDFASIDTKHSESEDDVPINLLKRKLVKNEDETDSQSKTNHIGHLRIHTGPHKLHDKKHECEICSKKFMSRHYLNIHMENHIGIRKKCNQCDKEFKNSHSLKSHIRRHTEPKCENCEICGKKFSSKHNLKVHMENHKGITKNCDQCGKEYTNSNSLRKHMKWHTLCEKCEICGKKFSSKHYLNIHMENHMGITKKCNQCEKEFKNSNTLKLHMKWHTNPKPFKCENCGKLLGRKVRYTYHMAICKPQAGHFLENRKKTGNLSKQEKVREMSGNFH